jgi:hypothetical protein
MTKDEIAVSLITLFGIITIAKVTDGLVPAPWDIYFMAVLVVGWMALVFKGWERWQNRR